MEVTAAHETAVKPITSPTPVAAPVIGIAIVVRVIVVVVAVRTVGRGAVVVGWPHAGGHQQHDSTQKREQGFLQRIHSIGYDENGLSRLQSITTEKALRVKG